MKKESTLNTRADGTGRVPLGGDFRRFVASRFFTFIAMNMAMVAVGWQVYDITRDPFALGLVGLAQFLPAFLLTLPGGHTADIFDRRRLVLLSQAFQLAAVGGLLFLSISGNASRTTILSVLVLVGTARAFYGPAGQALVPLLVPRQSLTRAIAVSSSTMQAAIIIGPALGGLLYALGPGAVYGASALALAASMTLVFSIKGDFRAENHGPAEIAEVLAGIRYVWAKKEIFGAISLDLFAVLFGGATALLPVFARDILHTGPWGLGLLRSAPAAGAVCMALWLARRPLRRGAGTTMLACVALFGAATIVFGLSRSFVLSLASLAVLGAADMVSIVIRHTLIQSRTPDAMRGRVSAVNSIFIGASNELGEFESGFTAGIFGTVPAVVIGGVGTLCVVAAWSFLFPSLRRVDRLEAPRDEASP